MEKTSHFGQTPRPVSNTKFRSDCRKILIVRLGSFGDILHTIPAQQQISLQLPKIQIDWLTGPAYGDLLSSVPGISKVWVTNIKGLKRRPWSVHEIFHLFQTLRGQCFDVALDFQGLIKSSIMARLCGAQRVLGFPPESCREPAASYFYTDTVGSDNNHLHIIENNLRLSSFLGCQPSQITPFIPLNIDDQDKHYVDIQLKQLQVENPILINPGAGWVTKRWSAKNYYTLSTKIQSQLGLPVVFTYGPGEEHLMKDIRSNTTSHKILAFPTNILQLAALCRRSRLLIGGDTGPLHLAVATGTPTVAIMGPTAAWRNGPYHPDDEIVRRDLLCSNSYRRKCYQCTCMDIPVEEVFQAVIRRLARKSHNHAFIEKNSSYLDKETFSQKNKSQSEK